MAMDEASKRRVRAGRMLLKGKTPAQVAAAVGAPRQTVYRWLDVLNDGGIDALRVINKGGRPAQLDGAQYQELRQVLLDGPQAAGFDTDLWTLKRVREVIRRRFGVQFSEVHVWRVLGKLGLDFGCGSGVAFRHQLTLVVSTGVVLANHLQVTNNRENIAGKIGHGTINHIDAGR